jgi:AraC-like DNA-binding protein
MIQDGQSPLLLSDRFSKVSTADMRVARPVIERLQGPYQARPRVPAASGAVEIRAADCGHVAVSTFSFGRSVDIVPHGLLDTVIVTTAVRGRAAMAIDGSIYRMDAGDTLIAHEEDHPVFRYESDTEVLKLRFQRSRLESLFGRMSGSMPGTRLHFDAAMSDPGVSARWLALLRFLLTTLNGGGTHAPSMLELAAIEDLLMLTLLNNQPHNHTDAGARLPEDTASTYYGRADRYIREHLADDIALADIANAAYCSPRSLARAFRQAGQAAPMRYVHQLRLERIHAALLAPASDGATVAQLAFEWGYRHLGEFNRQYRAAFGETPSQTRERRGAAGPIVIQ